MSAQHAGHATATCDNPDVHHEDDDINVRAILWFVVVLTASCSSINVAMWGMFSCSHWYEAQERAGGDAAGAPAPTEGSPDFPEPRAAGDAVEGSRRSSAPTRQRTCTATAGWTRSSAWRASRSRRRRRCCCSKGMPVRPELADATSKARTSPRPASRAAAADLPAGGADKSAPAGGGGCVRPGPRCDRGAARGSRGGSARRCFGRGA